MRKSPRRRSPLISPHEANHVSILKTVNMGKFQQSQLEIRLSKETGKISKGTQERFARTIENAMALGQTRAVLGQLHKNTHFRIIDPLEKKVVTDPVCKSTPIRHMWTFEELKDSQGRSICIKINHQLASVLRWLYTSGVHFCFASVMHKPNGLFYQGEATMSTMVYLVALFLPENPNVMSDDPPGTFLSCWNDVRTPKCLDDSMIPTWSERIFKCIECGQKNTVLCTLQASDFEPYIMTMEEKRQQQQRENITRFSTNITPKERDNKKFVCVLGRDHLTMQPLTNIVVGTYDNKEKNETMQEWSKHPMWCVEERFSTMVDWVHRQGWYWTLLFATCNSQHEPGKIVISQWAYFTVIMDPIVPGSYF